MTFPLLFFGPIEYFAALTKGHSSLEIHEHYKKQTYRNRCVIAGANGPLKLQVPVHRRNHTPMSQAFAQGAHDWKQLHLKSLRSAYRSSPYFEYYEDKVESFYAGEHKLLIEWNMASVKLISDLLKLDLSFDLTTDYKDLPQDMDYRLLISPKEVPIAQTPRYMQVFESRNGFLPNLSILDALFCQGPSTRSYLLEIADQMELREG